MISIGKINKLIVARESSSGFYLEDLDALDEVFLPPAMAPLNLTRGDEVDAFVYLDTQDRRIATCDIPYATVGEYALLDVAEVQDFGAFFDWGIQKDLLVPGNEQKIKVRKYDSHIVRVCLEEGTDRIYGTTKLGKYIEASDFDIIEGDKVKITPAHHSELGYRVIINKKFIGMLYQNELFKKVVIGKEYDGVVKKIRQDGLVDVALQAQGIQNLLDSKEVVLDFLEKNGGSSSLYDKSSPEEIKTYLGMSKKSFKSAIGMLYKEKLITISKDGIELTKK